MPRPIVLLHGYSSDADGLKPWRDALTDDALADDVRIKDIRLGNYISLSSEITIRDIAEGFDRALREQGGLGPDEEFDAIVHSTGSLVIREWLVSYEGRRRRLKHLIGLAPANFGSPMAHRGRSVLGALLKGSKDPRSPDFLEPGDRVLSALELGSSYTWDLAHRDLLTAEDVAGDVSPKDLKPIYSREPDTPYPFVFIGLERYMAQNLVVHEDGYDGTVRWAGAALNSRKLVIDLTRAPTTTPEERVQASPPPPPGAEIPLMLVAGLNHATILKKPGELIEPVLDALKVDSADAYKQWTEKYAGVTGTGEPLTDQPARWQQFVVRVVDERGDPVPDYYMALGTGRGAEFQPLDEFSMDVHTYRNDPSFRCFHVNLDAIPAVRGGDLQLRLLASSGTPWVGYYGYAGAGPDPTRTDGRHDDLTDDGTDADGPPAIVWNARLDLDLSADDEFSFFYEYTTTLVEIRLNREPNPPFDPRHPERRMDLIQFADS